MSRWMIEKSGTGIEKSGTGIEKSGTGIEKSGTGIEKSGTGLRKGFLACSLAAIAISTQVSANESLDPAGVLQLVVDHDTVALSWIIDGSVFSGVASVKGSYANLVLTEIGLVDENASVLIAGSGTGTESTGTGSKTKIAGSGTGVEVAGSGTGVEVAGSGTGVEIAGSGTGTEIAGSGTGSDSEDHSGSSSILIAGSGTGSDSISITLPDGTGLQMEVILGCNTASVSVLDANYAEIVTFENVRVIGSTGFCNGNQFGGYDEITLPVKFGNGNH